VNMSSWCVRNGLKMDVSHVTCYFCKARMEFKPQSHLMVSCDCGRTSVDCDPLCVRYVGCLPEEHIAFEGNRQTYQDIMARERNANQFSV